MADPTAVVSRETVNEISSNRFQGLIKTSEDMQIGALAALLYGTGTVEFGDDVANLTPLGIVHQQPLGDSSKMLGDGTNEIVTKAGDTLKKVEVVDSSAITDMLKPVWATDGNAFTMTAPSNGEVIGFITKWHTGTTCDVQLLSLEMAAVLHWLTAGIIAIP